MPQRCLMAEVTGVAYDLDMAERIELDTKVSPQGRVVIPIEIRRALEVAGGGRVRFVLEHGEVSVVSSRTLAIGLWANNHGGDAGDSFADVRAARHADHRSRSREDRRTVGSARHQSRSRGPWNDPQPSHHRDD
jgi:AbrB family looped-hinge helix DNA binding protein